MRKFKIVVERHPDGYVAYPIGVDAIIVGQGDTYEEALADAKSAIRFYIDTLGVEALGSEPPVSEAFIADAELSV